jgi:hypothetical protein
MTLRDPARDFVLAVTLAVFYFYGIWVQVLAANFVYHESRDPNPLLGALLVSVLAGATGLALLASLRRAAPFRRWPWTFRLPYLWFFALVVLYMLTKIGEPRLLARARLVPAFLLVVAATAWLPLRPEWLGRVTRVISVLLLMASPFCLVVFGQLGWQAWRNTQRDFTQETISARADSGPTPRAVIVVLDELDQRLLFDQRPAGLALPEFDRLRTTSLMAIDAVPPDRFTERAMLGVLTGQPIAEDRVEDYDRIAIRTRTGGPWLAFASLPTIFHDARRLRLNAAVAGWYNPYCRLLRGVLSYCYVGTRPLLSLGVSTAKPFLTNVIQPWLRLLLPLNRFRFVPLHTEEQERALQADDYRDLLSVSDRLLRDRGLNVLLLHFNVPHPPAFFDRRTGEIRPRFAASYLDNLALADRTLGHVRRVLEAEGLWDETALVVMGDHGWRAEMWSRSAHWTEEDQANRPAGEDPRTALLIKLPGQRRPAVFTAPTTTAKVRPLLEAVLQGKVQSPEDAGAWLATSR